MGCNCSESYTVTDTWENEYYVVPKASTENLPQNPNCSCGSGQDYGCETSPTGSPNGLSTQTSQDPSSGQKVVIGEPKKTKSKKSPEQQKCGGDCSSTPGPVQILKDESVDTGNTKSVAVKIKISGAWLDCKCTTNTKYGSTNAWRVDCPEYETTINMDAKIYKRTREQQYTVSVSCQS